MDYFQTVLAASAVWLVWRVLRNFILPSSLDNIPGPPSPSFITGHIFQLFNARTGWQFHRMLREKYGPAVRLQQLFGKPMLYVFDPVALHSIVIKDQYVYERNRASAAVNEFMVGPNILAAVGERHRAQRKMLNPAFSISHMRYLTPVFYETMHRMRRAIAAQTVNGPAEVDMLSWMGRAALELVGQGGLGYSFDPLERDMHDGYGHALKQFQPALAKSRFYLMLAPYCKYIRPKWLRRVLLEFVPNRGLQRLKDLSDIMQSSSEGIYRAKKEAFLRGDEAVREQVGRGKDIMSILLRANMQANEEDRLPEQELIAQMSTFVIAGMDTTSNALARILHLLALHQDVQDNLRAEVRAASDGDDIPYDKLVDLPYMDAICRETLRVYAPVPLISRQPIEDIILPLSTPIRGKDGKLINEILVPEGTMVQIANWSCNVNKAIWGDDAEEWKPERWLSPLPDRVKDAKIPGIYANLMTFLGGSRACIGFKFSQLEMKVVLALLIGSFKFHPSKKDVFWNFTAIIYPSVGKDASSPSLPLVVESISS